MSLSAKQRRRYLLIPIPAVAAVAVGALVATSALADAAALEWKLTDPGSEGSLADVEALAADDVWAVGMTRPNGAGETVAIHWNGEKWEDTKPPKGTSLNDVTAVAGEEVWAVGAVDAATTLTTRWDGKAWESVPTPKPDIPADQEPYLTAVDGAAADDVWAVGSSSGNSFPGESTAFMQHWDGKEWSLKDVPLPEGTDYSLLRKVQVFAADDAWAAGQTIDGQGVISPLLLHWDGKEWSQRELAIPDVSISDITVTEDGRVWLAGAVYPDSDPFAGTPLLVVGDGQKWTELEVPSKERWLSSITPDGKGGVVAVGATSEEALAVSSDGSTVVNEALPAIDPNADYSSLEGVCLVPGTETLWTVGFTDKYLKPIAAHTV